MYAPTTPFPRFYSWKLASCWQQWNICLSGQAQVTGSPHRREVAKAQLLSAPLQSCSFSSRVHISTCPDLLRFPLTSLTPRLSSHLRTEAPKQPSFPTRPGSNYRTNLPSPCFYPQLGLCLLSTSFAPGAHLTWGLWLRK